MRVNRVLATGVQFIKCATSRVTWQYYALLEN